MKKRYIVLTYILIFVICSSVVYADPATTTAEIIGSGAEIGTGGAPGMLAWLFGQGKSDLELSLDVTMDIVELVLDSDTYDNYNMSLDLKDGLNILDGSKGAYSISEEKFNQIKDTCSLYEDYTQDTAWYDVIKKFDAKGDVGNVYKTIALSASYDDYVAKVKYYEGLSASEFYASRYNISSSQFDEIRAALSSVEPVENSVTAAFDYYGGSDTALMAQYPDDWSVRKNFYDWMFENVRVNSDGSFKIKTYEYIVYTYQLVWKECTVDSVGEYVPEEYKVYFLEYMNDTSELMDDVNGQLGGGNSVDYVDSTYSYDHGLDDIFGHFSIDLTGKYYFVVRYGQINENYDWSRVCYFLYVSDGPLTFTGDAFLWPTYISTTVESPAYYYYGSMSRMDGDIVFTDYYVDALDYRRQGMDTSFTPEIVECNYNIYDSNGILIKVSMSTAPIELPSPPIFLPNQVPSELPLEPYAPAETLDYSDIGTDTPVAPVEPTTEINWLQRISEQLGSLSLKINPTPDTVFDSSLDGTDGTGSDGGNTDPQIKNIFNLLILILLAILVLIMKYIALVVAMFNIPANTELLNEHVIAGLQFFKNIELPLFNNLTVFDLIQWAFIFVLTTLFVGSLKKRIDRQQIA